MGYIGCVGRCCCERGVDIVVMIDTFRNGRAINNGYILCRIIPRYTYCICIPVACRLLT